MEDEDKIKNALLKKALGYDADEVVEEYACDQEGEMRLTKKKRLCIRAVNIAGLQVLYWEYLHFHSAEIL